MEKEKRAKYSLWEWVKAISILILVMVFSYKIYSTPIDLKIDFPTLLSLLLALFSVALAALFYFKATETSNTFYDNTYNFTKDIAQLLVKIESGFGERLRHLDEGYSSMRDYIQQMPNNGGKEEVKQRIQEEKEEIKKVLEERNSMIMELVEKSHLHGEEKRQFLEKLKEKESELEGAQKEISKMKQRMVLNRVRRSHNQSQHSLGAIKEYTRYKVVPEMGGKYLFNRSLGFIQRRFARIKDELPENYLADMEKSGFIDSEGELTREGAQFIRDSTLES